MPRRASCQVASHPASPPPMIVTRSVILGRALVVTGLVAAEDDLAFLLGLLLQQVRPPAVGTGFGQRPVVRGEAALGITAAAVEGAAPAALALDDLALAAL